MKPFQLLLVISFLMGTFMMACSSSDSGGSSSSTATNNETVEFYDTFEGTSLDSNLWTENLSGNGSTVTVSNGVLEVKAVNDGNPETPNGKAGVDFATSALSFQAFSAEAKVLNVTGESIAFAEDNSLLRLEGYAFNTGIRSNDEETGEVWIGIYLYASGRVRVYSEKCNDASCDPENIDLIINEDILNVDLRDAHTLALGFDAASARILFQIDDNPTRVVAVDTSQFPVTTLGWRYASLRARSLSSFQSESITGEFDNVRVGSIEEIFGSIE